MDTLRTDGVQELDGATLREVRGGNPVIMLGAAVASAFGWGLKFGYTELGPWLMGQNRC